MDITHGAEDSTPMTAVRRSINLDVDGLNVAARIRRANDENDVGLEPMQITRVRQHRDSTRCARKEGHGACSEAGLGSTGGDRGNGTGLELPCTQIVKRLKRLGRQPCQKVSIHDTQQKHGTALSD